MPLPPCASDHATTETRSSMHQVDKPGKPRGDCCGMLAATGAKRLLAGWMRQPQSAPQIRSARRYTYRPSRLRSRNSTQQALARIEASLKTLTSDFRRPACLHCKSWRSVRPYTNRPTGVSLGCAIAVVVSRQIHFRLGDGGNGVPWNHGIQAMSLTHASRMSTKKT
jgi:hypothetical protein